MALRLNDAVFNQASDEAMQAALIKTAEVRLKAIGLSGYSKVVTQLKASAVDKTLIAELEAKVNAATDKNQVILDVVKKGGAIAKAIGDILNRCV